MNQRLLKRIGMAAAVAVTLGVIAVVVFPGFFGISEMPKGEAAEEEIKGTATVVTATPTAGSLSPVALAYGAVASSPQHTFVIALMRDGVFKSVNVRDGDAVRAGQPIVTVSTAPANTAAFAQAKSAVDFTTQDLARVERLFANKLATNDQTATARKALADAQVNLEQQRKIGAGDLEEVLRAPFDGIITGLMATPGDKVQANTTIATVSSRSDVVVQLSLDPEDASKLAPGAVVKLTGTFQDSMEIEGKLTSIGATIDPMTHLVKAIASVPASMSAHLALGTTLVAHIDLPARQGILVPRAALLEDAMGPYVFTVSEGEAKRQDIKVLVETDDMALIDGLDPALGSQVVISGNAELDDDTPVQEEGKPSGEDKPAAEDDGGGGEARGEGSQPMNLAQWAAQHRRSILFLLAVVSIGGAFSAFGLPVALFPEVNFPRIAITIDAGDQPAAQMVTQVTRPVEQAVKAVPGLLEVRSTTSRGTAELSLNFDWGVDMSVATLQVQAEISRVLPSLPAGATFDIRRMNTNVFPVAAYSLTSDKLDLVKIREIAQYELLPLVSSIKGVQRVEVLGGAAREIRVDVDPGRLASYGLTMDDVSKALTAANVLSAVGRVQDRHKLLLTLSDNQITTPDQIRQTIVRGGPQGAIYLSNVGRVYETAAPSWTIVTGDGHPAIILQIKQQQDGNTVQIVKDVKAALAAYAPKLPPDFHISNWYDQSELILGSARSVFEAVLIGVGLAGLVLLLFLRNLKITLVTLIVVPAVLASTVLLLSVLGMSFNIMTLGGMAAAIGLIIDDAIVIIEQIDRRLHSTEKGHAEIRAATWEFLQPLAGSSAATIIIFVPLAFLTGVTGAFFKALSLTLAAALIVSFLAAFFVIPLMADYVLTPKDAKVEEHSGPIFRRVLRVYRRIFNGLLAFPAAVLPVFAVFLAAGYLAYTQVGTGFMPIMDEGGFVFDYISPPGTSLEDTDAMLNQVEKILRATPEVLTYSRRTGLQLGAGLTESNTGDIFVRLKPTPRRPIEEIMTEIREKAQKTIPALDVETAQLMEDLIGDLTAVPQPIEVQIFGDDPAVLNEIAPKVADAIMAVPGVTEIRNGVVIAGDAFDIRVDPLKAGLEGLNPDLVTQQVDAFLSGTVATQVRNIDRTIDVRVWVPPTQRATPNDIREFQLTAPDGHKVPLSRVAQVSLLTGQPEITRDNLKPMVAVTARIEGRDLGSTAAEVKALLDKSGLFTQGTYFQLGGLYAQQQIAFRGLIGVLVAAFALVFALLIYLYERLMLAILIIAMPLSAMGAVFIGLWLTGIELNISAMMGMTMVVGIVTEIAIFYFSEYELLIREGISHDDAIVAAGANRFRPIAMTTIAAILALLPLAIGLGQGSDMQKPLAIAIISGLIAQMPLVLLVMPLAFSVLSRKSKKQFTAGGSPSFDTPIRQPVP